MKKILGVSLVLSLCSTLTYADLSNSTRKDNSQSDSKRSQEQTSIQEQKSINNTKSQGIDDSSQKSTTQSLSTIHSNTKSVAHTKSEGWEIKTNPIPFILEQLRRAGIDRRAIYLTNKDIGTSYYVDENEEIIDNIKKNYYLSKATTRGVVSSDSLYRLKQIVSLLNYAGKISDKTIKILTVTPGENTIKNIEKRVVFALKQAIKEIRFENIEIYSCRFGGNNDIYTCNNGEYVVQLTTSVPILMRNGVPVFSAERIGYATPLISLTYANSTSDALSTLEQNSETASITKTVRNYTNYLRSVGETKIASGIESKFIEKAITNNVTNSVSALIPAINSGNPLAVLKIFQ